jgi:hypothetical protein
MADIRAHKDLQMLTGIHGYASPSAKNTFSHISVVLFGHMNIQLLYLQGTEPDIFLSLYIAPDKYHGYEYILRCIAG